MVVMSTHNVCLEQKYEKYQNFLSENFHFFVCKMKFFKSKTYFNE